MLVSRSLLFILETDLVMFGAPNLSFGLSGAWCTLARWETIDDRGALGSTRKEALGSRLGFFLILGVFRDFIPKVLFCVFCRVWTSGVPGTEIWSEKPKHPLGEG